MARIRACRFEHPRARVFSCAVGLAAVLILAALGQSGWATTVVQLGPIKATFYNSGETSGSVTSDKDWTTTERDDVAAEIMMWVTQLGQVWNQRPVEIHLMWNNLPGNTLASANNNFTGNGTTAWTKVERLWRTGTHVALSGFDSQLTFDSGTSLNVGSGSPVAGQWDFRTVVAHELGHALGFASVYNDTTDKWESVGLTEWDKQLRDASTGGNAPAVNSTGSPGNFNQTANPAYFAGPLAVAANGGNRPEIYAPGTFSDGSSLTHLNTSTYPGALMRHSQSSGTSTRAPTALELAMFQDLGWTAVVKKTWDKGAGNLIWTSASNWDADGTPTSANIAAFTNAGLANGDTIDMNGNKTVDGLTLDTTTSFTIGGISGLLTLSRGFLVRSDASSGTQTIVRDLAFSTGGNLHIEGAGELVVSGTIVGAIPITKTGLGTLVLSGTNTYSAATTVANGALNIRNPSALGTGANGTTVFSGAALELQNGISVGSESLSIAGDGISSGGALRSVSGDNAWAGPVALTATSAIGVDAGTLTLSATLSGSFALSKAGAGTLVLTGTNSYTGLTTVSNGVLNIRNPSALGTTAGATTVLAGAALELQNGISVGNESLTLAGDGIASSGALRNVSGNNNWAGSVTLAANSTIGADAGILTLNGAVSGSSFSLTKVGAGTLILGVTNSYGGGTNIQGGLVSVSADNRLGSGGVSLGNGGTLHISGSSAVASSKTLQVLSGGGTLSSNNSAGVTWSGLIDNSLGQTLHKSSGGTLTLSGSANWGSGAIFQVDTGAGVVNLAPGGAAAINVASTNAQVVIQSGATLNVNAASNDPFTDDTVTSRHVHVTNGSTTGFNVTAGSTAIGDLDGTGNTVISANAALTASHVRQTALTIHGSLGQDDARVTLRDSPPGLEGSTSGNSTLKSLSIDHDSGAIGLNRKYFGTLDVGNNNVIVDWTGSSNPYTEINDMLRAALNLGGYDGGGILSMTAVNTNPSLYAVGILDNEYVINNLGIGFGDGSAFPMLEGSVVPVQSVVLKFTYIGDFDLDGLMSSNDVSTFFSTYDAGASSGHFWWEGDSNYDGLLDSQDVSSFFGAYDPSAPHLPEPGSLVLAGVAGAGLLLLARHGRRCRLRRGRS